MATRTLDFPGGQGAQLVARLELPAIRSPDAVAIFAHCFTCSKDVRAAVMISRSLADRGIAVLRFDFTGLGESEGEFGDTTYSGSVADLVAAARFVTETIAAPQLLIGHSLGGAAAIHAAHAIPSVRAVVTIGAPSHTEHALALFASAAERIAADGSAEVTIAGRSFHVSQALVDDLREARVLDAARSLDRPLLIMHAPGDAVVPIEHAARLYSAARHPKSFVSLDDADHLLSRAADAEYAAGVLAVWASRYFVIGATVPPGVPPAGASAEPAEPSPEESTSVTDAGDGFRTSLLVGGHRLVADEPVRGGGRDEGPSPVALLTASLGACTSMTLRSYASRKGWPLERVVVHVSHARITASTTPGAVPAPFARLTREVELVGPLTDEQRDRLLEIAERCPIHRTLEGGVEVVTTLRPAQGARGT
ncbi:MAG: bifunctional alpha/beta hydrolase/OsmC family protein [Gemmatimonadota bacterium]